MTPTELEAWAAGYLAGWARADENREHLDLTEQVREAFRRAESAARRKRWDDAVKRGENPTPYEQESTC